MAATVEICESNGAGETITHSVSNSNYGSTDAANLTAASYPITAGNNGYEKFQRLHVTAMGGSSKIDNVKVWASAAPPANHTHKTSAETQTYVAQTYATPVATTSAKADLAMPTSAPATANLGIAGSLTGSLAAAGYSDYQVHQMQTTASATAGTTLTLYWQYDETA